MKPKCPECGDENSGRMWYSQGVVRCWTCDKMSFYIDWFKERILTMESDQSENSFHRFRFDFNRRYN